MYVLTNRKQSKLSPMTPEDLARQNVDRQLDQSGWIIQDLANMNIMAGVGVAVREFPLTTSEGDESASKPLGRKPSVSMKQILKQLSMGSVHPDVTSTLAARLTRIAARRKQVWHDEFEKASGSSLAEVAKQLLDRTDPDKFLGKMLPRSCIVPDYVCPALVKADCPRFKPNPELTTSRHVNIALNAWSTQKRASKLIAGVGRPRLNLTRVRSLSITLAPFAEQSEIVNQVAETIKAGLVTKHGRGKNTYYVRSDRAL